MTARLLTLFLLCAVTAAAQVPRRGPRELPDALALDQATVDADLPGLALKLVRSSLTLAALLPKGLGGFDFVPSDRIRQRAGNGYHHLGDLVLRVRTAGGEWKDYDTARERKPVLALNHPGAIGAADLAPTIPADCPLHVEREWTTSNGRLGLEFVLRNTATAPVEIGGLGIPMVFNNILTDRSLRQAHDTCCFFDPYVGQDAGYLQVTRLSGKGPALVVAPFSHQNGGEGAVGGIFATPFEAWMPLSEPTRPSQTFEGAFAWMVHTKAYAEREWSKADPWNPPTSATLQPGETRRYGVQFLLSPDIRSIEKTLANAGRPVAIGIPGYILPMDQEGRLFLRYRSPVRSIQIDPPGALVCRAVPPSPAGVCRRTVLGKKWGRARLTITYADGVRQSIHYYVTKPAAQAVADLGRFLFTKQWFFDPADPFHRSPSVMSYDSEADRLVTQDSRVWIAGLGDEAGSGSWLAAAMKLFVQPDAEQVAKYEQFVDNVLWGGIQFKDGPNKSGVRKSLFYYEPKELPNFPYDPARDWRSWTSWNKRASEDIGRGYNYPHVVAAYWAMYRVKRFGSLSARALVGANNSENQIGSKAIGRAPSYSPSGKPPRERANKPDPEGSPADQPNSPAYSPLQDGKGRSWQWYLNQAYETTKFAFSRDAQGQRRVGYVELGLMEGDIFLALLEDLKREGWDAKAAEIEALMKERADRWSHEEYPFGSEMAWDSTGQEEVYAWSRYFGHEPQAQVSLSSILGYMPTMPHWGYNGNARRYWDFLYGGKLTRIERQLHHYGSGLNALPVLAEYRRHPDDFYLLRVGYGGMMGALSNIDREGFASAAFHSFPSTLKWDAYSGDYGPNFFGHAMGSATYVARHPEFGWLAFGGNVRITGNRVHVDIRDSLRQRLFLAPLSHSDGTSLKQLGGEGAVSPASPSRGLWLTLDSGQFDQVDINTKTGAIRVGLVGRAGERKALLRVEGGTLQGYRKARRAYVVPLTDGVTWVSTAKR